MTVNTNTFLGMASNGMAQIASRGLMVASTIAVAIVWNDDIGPTMGQEKQKRNAMLATLARRLADKGCKVSSIETWRKQGQKFALNYSAEIERLILGVKNAEGRNSEATGTEYVASVVSWAKATFPTLKDFQDDVAGVGKSEVSEDDKKNASAHKFLKTVSTKDTDSLLYDVTTIAAFRRITIDKDASVTARADAASEINAILAKYLPANVVEAEAETQAELDAAPDLELAA